MGRLLVGNGEGVLQIALRSPAALPACGEENIVRAVYIVVVGPEKLRRNHRSRAGDVQRRGPAGKLGHGHLVQAPPVPQQVGGGVHMGAGVGA